MYIPVSLTGMYNDILDQKPVATSSAGVADAVAQGGVERLVGGKGLQSHVHAVAPVVVDVCRIIYLLVVRILAAQRRIR